MKLLGAGLIWTSLILLGSSMSFYLKKRITLLQKTKMMIDEMKIQIEYLHLPLCDLVTYFEKNEIYSALCFLTECRKHIENGVDFPVAWNTAVTNSRCNYSSGEKEKLCELSRVLGSSDTKGQISILKLYSENFENFSLGAIEIYKKYSNLIIVCSVFLGSMIFVLLI